MNKHTGHRQDADRESFELVIMLLTVLIEDSKQRATGTLLSGYPFELAG